MAVSEIDDVSVFDKPRGGRPLNGVFRRDIRGRRQGGEDLVRCVLVGVSVLSRRLPTVFSSRKRVKCLMHAARPRFL